MRWKEANSIAYIIADITVNHGYQILKEDMNILMKDKNFQEMYSEWKEWHEKPIRESDEYDKKMTEKYGADWPLLKKKHRT